jgi:hypothetical protein
MVFSGSGRDVRDSADLKSACPARPARRNPGRRNQKQRRTMYDASEAVLIFAFPGSVKLHAAERGSPRIANSSSREASYAWSGSPPPRPNCAALDDYYNGRENAGFWPGKIRLRRLQNHEFQSTWGAWT